MTKKKLGRPNQKPPTNAPGVIFTPEQQAIVDEIIRREEKKPEVGIIAPDDEAEWWKHE